MKSLQELEAIRKKTLEQPTNDEPQVRILIGMATCGIAAGARPVLAAFVGETAKRSLKGIVIAQTGCIGMCRLEPIVEVICPNQPKVTYAKVTPELALHILDEHVLGGRVLEDHTLMHYQSLDSLEA